MGGLGRKFLHRLPDMENLRNLESPFILWIQIDIYFLANTNLTQRGESLGFVEAFLRKEGSKNVFVGWRYLDEMTLEEANIVFRGPPVKMILMAQHLEGVVWHSIRGR